MNARKRVATVNAYDVNTLLPSLPRAQASSLPRKPPPTIATDLADCRALSRLKKSSTFHTHTQSPIQVISNIP